MLNFIDKTFRSLLPTPTSMSNTGPKAWSPKCLNNKKMHIKLMKTTEFSKIDKFDSFVMRGLSCFYSIILFTVKYNTFAILFIP
jgi:hypothetical protein